MAKKYTKNQVLEAAEKSNGVMEYVAIKLNCAWDTARKYVQMWDETREAFAIAETKLHSLAYKSFHKSIANGERWAIERILNTSARRNGHGDVIHQKTEHNIKGGPMIVPMASGIEEWERLAVQPQKKLMADAIEMD